MGSLQENLQRLLAPSSVAVVGASERMGPGRQVIENLQQIGFGGTIVPINPKYETVLGHRCYPSLAVAADINGSIDAVAILLGRDHIVPALREAEAANIRAGWAFASGFAESGAEGSALQQELTAFCAEHDIAFCGPNCVGYVNPGARSAAFSAPISPSLTPGSVAAVAQSGSIAMALINSARGIGFRAVVSSGNEAVLDCADYLEHFVNDPHTRVILAFIEQLRRPDRFVAVADAARAAGKPLIVLKVGRSEIAQRATAAHTGALAGADAVYDAVFRKHGVIRVGDLDEMLETAEAFVRLGNALPHGRRVGMLTVSGGEISLVADLAEGLDLEFPPWSEATQHAFAGVLPDYADVDNPLDAWGFGKIEETYALCVDAAADDQNVDLVMISQDGPNGLAPSQTEQFAIVARAAAAARTRTNKPIIAFSHLAGGLDPTLRELFAEGGVPFLQGTREGLMAARNVIAHMESRSAKPFSPAAKPQDVDEHGLDGTAGRLDEIASKALFRRYGIPCVNETLCRTADEAVETARQLGVRVVMKIVSAALPHKSDAGGVLLGIEGDDAVRKAFETLIERGAQQVGREAIGGVVVQEMVDDAVAEVIVGVATDPTFGPVVVFGLGGIAVELFADRALAIPPISPDEAREMIESTKTAALLRGFRGEPPGDVDALIDALVQVGALASGLRDRLLFADINPILVRRSGSGIVAVDGMVELRA